MAIINSQVHAYEANTPKRPWALRYAAEMPRLPIKTLRPAAVRRPLPGSG